MVSIYAGALMLAGLFTLVPGRLMHAVLFGSLKGSPTRGCPDPRFFGRRGRLFSGRRQKAARNPLSP